MYADLRHIDTCEHAVSRQCQLLGCDTCISWLYFTIIARSRRPQISWLMLLVGHCIRCSKAYCKLECDEIRIVEPFITWKARRLLDLPAHRQRIIRGELSVRSSFRG